MDKGQIECLVRKNRNGSQMMKRQILFILTLITSCTQVETPFMNADLVFVRSSDTYMDQAITAATSSDASDNFTHVAILELQSDSLFVIEAAPDLGVVRRPFSDFFADNCPSGHASDYLVFKRVKPEIISQLADRRGVDGSTILNEFVELAKSMVGLQYDYEYRPLNGKMYCSELVFDSYIEMIPKPWDPHLFKEAPMNFLSPDGSLPDFWKFNFEIVQGIPVPQGEPGTNPNDMAKSDVLIDLGCPID